MLLTCFIINKCNLWLINSPKQAAKTIIKCRWKDKNACNVGLKNITPELFLD